MTGSVLQFVMQSVQVTLALPGGPGLDPGIAVALGRFSFLLTVSAYVPAAVMYGAVAVVVLRHGGLPRALGWFSAFTGIFHAVMALGLVVRSGPLVPGEPLTYATRALRARTQNAMTGAPAPSRPRPM